ncbi:MAG: hypothetical protein A2138_26800 [Deltaproteobacteria bacterium RBG_16_71_12]|nr:MAG: hypothetical protein A2138_26800 [Deltaproteobacteria bacterium RBG_16_71_12]
MFVVRLPLNLSFAPIVDQIAQAGGTVAAYPADEPTAIGAAIDDAAARISACRFDVPASSALAIDVAGTAVAHDALNGWELVDGDTVELFGTACAAALSGAQVSVTSCL